MVDHMSPEHAFTAFVREHGRRLKHALISSMGGQEGQEATAEALAYAWEHWEQLQDVSNLAGYLYRVGRTRGLPPGSPTVRLFGEPQGGSGDPPWIEPRLEKAVADLSEMQRTVVMLIHGFSWTYRETATFLNVSPGSIQRHMDRAMRKLRRDLKVAQDA